MTTIGLGVCPQGANLVQRLCASCEVDTACVLSDAGVGKQHCVTIKHLFFQSPPLEVSSGAG
eukprot:COSAG01_NODE_18782_length_1053_cov_2.356394_2_plen_62_part_00